MPGQKKSNVIEYVFQGDTLDLEESIKRVTKLVNAATRNFKEFQDGALTPSQKDQIKRVKRLRDELKSFLGPEAEDAILDDSELKRQVDARTKQAINDAISLHKQSLKLDDKEFEQKREHQKVLNADQAAFYASQAGQLKGESQAGQLERLAGIVRPSIGEEQYQSIMNVTEAFKIAQQQFAEGKITQEELTIATRNLDEAYKKYATTLQRVKVNQKEANKGPEKKTGLLGQLFGKFKSISLYRLARLAVQAILSQLKSGFDAIAKKNRFFNDTMSQLTSTFKYVSNQVSSVLAPALSIITPILHNLSMALSDVTDKLAAVFSVFAGDDNVALATYHLEDYTESLKKANKGMKGIDELNVLDTTNAEVDHFKLVTTESVLGNETVDNLKQITTVFQDLARLVGGVLSPILSSLSDIFIVIGTALGDIFTILGPVFSIVTTVISVVSKAVGGVFSFLLNNIIMPIVKWLGYMTDHIWLLVGALTAVLVLLALFKWQSIISSITTIIVGVKTLTLAIWDNIKALVASVAQSIKNIAIRIKEAVAAWIAAGAYWKLALAIAATAGLAALAVISVIGVATAAGTATANSSLGNEPHMAKGGIVKQPTLALVGEGNYNEAVVPLGNSPQFEDMKQDIAERVVMAGGSKGSNKQIVLNINGKELARAIMPDLEYALPQSGLKLRRS